MYFYQKINFTFILAYFILPFVHGFLKSSKSCLKSPPNYPFCLIGTNYTCVENNVVLISPQVRHNEQFTIYCYAKFPMDLSITGFNLNEDFKTEFIRPDQGIKSNPSKSKSHYYTVVISAENLNTPRRITIWKLQQKNVNVSFLLLRPGLKLFSKNEKRTQIQPSPISNLLTFPCIATDPLKINNSTLTLTKTLYTLKRKVENPTVKKIDNNSTTLVTPRLTITTIETAEHKFSIDNKSLIYDPSVGLKLNLSYLGQYNPTGNFSCTFDSAKRSDEDNIERFSFFVMPKENLSVIPKFSEIILFQNGTLHLACEHISPVFIVGNFNQEIIITSRGFKTTFSKSNLVVGDFGKFTCKTDKIILHEWTLETLDAWNNTKLSLKFHYENSQQFISCESNSQSTPLLLTTHCYGEVNCKLRLPCLENENYLECANTKSGLAQNKNSSVIEFNTRDYHFSQGIIKCSTGNISYWTNYIRGFDGLIYTNWYEAPETALVEIILPNDRLYSGGIFSFTCRATSFLSDGDLLMYYRKKNSTKISRFPIIDLQTEKSYRDRDGYTTVTRSLKVTTAMSQILCFVPVWNSNEWKSVSKRINVELPEAPVIKSKPQLAIFIKNETERTLRCAADGFPQPKIIWMKDQKILSSSFKQVDTNDEDNANILYFPRIEEFMEGQYICIASNCEGNVSQVFKVAVKDMQLPTFGQQALSSQNNNYTFTLGDKGQILVCNVQGYPRPNIVWKFNGTVISEDSHFSAIRNENSLNTISTLHFPQITKQLDGVFECVAKTKSTIFIQEFFVHIKEKEKDGNDIFVIAISAVAGFLLLLLLVAILKIWQAKKEIRNLSKEEVEEFFEGNSSRSSNCNGYEGLCSSEILKLPYDKRYEIPRDKLNIDTNDILGSGMYGLVFKGKFDKQGIVAVKTVKQESEVSYFKALLSEVKIMSHLGVCDNAVNFIGACTGNIKKRELYIVVEYCSRGSLESYLRQHRKQFDNDEIAYANNDLQAVEIECNTKNVGYGWMFSEGSELNESFTIEDLLRWSIEIAQGMEHLANKKVVHADLSSRNVLLNEYGTAKITDFGLSRQMYEQTMYVKKQQQPLPWKSMAIESLREMQFSTQSDIWAFGVTLWEIFSIGDTPFAGRSWSVDFVEELCNGLRMKQPKYATNALYDIMMQCWNKEPEKRQSFTVLVRLLSSIELDNDTSINWDNVNSSELKDSEGYLLPNHAQSC